MSSNAGNLNLYPFSFSVSNSCSRQSNAFERLVSKAPKTLPLSTDFSHYQHFQQFPTLSEGNVEYYILFENRIVDSKTCYCKSRHLSKHAFFKNFWSSWQNTYWPKIFFSPFFYSRMWRQLTLKRKGNLQT